MSRLRTLFPDSRILQESGPKYWKLAGSVITRPMPRVLPSSLIQTALNLIFHGMNNQTD